MEGYLTIKDAVAKYIEGCEAKRSSSALKILFKAVLAGFMIGLGAVASNVAAHNISNVGVARLVAGCVFPVGLMMVILLGAELFTGDCLVAMSVFGKNQKLGFFVKLLVIVYIGNFIGSLILAAMVAFSGQFDYSSGLLGAYTIKVALSKVGISFGQGIISGVLCNFLVCAAVVMATCAKDVTGKLLSSFFAIMLFVTAGFEHCVANMYYIPAGILAALNPAYSQLAVSTYGITEQQLASLNIQNLFIANLLPVTIGNIIGGIVFVALPLYCLNKTKK